MIRNERKDHRGLPASRQARIDPMTATLHEVTFGPGCPDTACDALAARTGLSKTSIKQAMIKGAVWLRRPKSKVRRLRKATTILKPGDTLQLYYDPTILDVSPPIADCVRDLGHYTIWFKPAGLLTQGTRYGDHCSLARQVEQYFKMRRKVFLVHRIDREASGLVIMAHNQVSAAKISALFRENRIEKEYAVWVRGDLTQSPSDGRIGLDLDGKTALTRFHIIRHDPDKDRTLVHAQIHTGRLHQIRRHFSHIGFPVMGDPSYGRGNLCPEGLQLVAFRIALDCPFGNGRIEAKIDLEGFET